MQITHLRHYCAYVNSHSRFTAIQLAKLSGFNPIITTASAHNEAYCKSAGATHIIDYHSTPYSSLASAVSSILRDVFGDEHKPIKVVYDTVSKPDTNLACWSVLSPGGTLIITLPPSKEINIGKHGPGAEQNEDGKKVAWPVGVVSNETLSDVRLAERMYAVLERMMLEGDVRPNRLQVLDGGLSAIEGGARRMAEGDVSGSKLVVRVPETPTV